MIDQLQAATERAEVLEAQLDDLQERYDRLLEAFGQHLEIPLCLQLTSNESRILGALLAKGTITKEALMAVVYADAVADDDVPEIKIIDVFVCKLRKKLLKHDIVIDTSWGQGYGISPESRDKVIALMDGEGIPTDKLKAIA